MSQWSWQLSIVLFPIVFGFIFWGKSSGKYTLYLISLSLVRQKMGDSMPYFFVPFSVLFCPFLCPCPYGMRFCLPAIGQTRPFGVFASGDSAIHPFGYPSHPIPSRPFMHSGIHPSMHPFALPHFSFDSSIPMRPNRLVASIYSTHPNASCENVPCIHPCPILRASIHRAVYVNHPPCWFVLLYPGNAALVYNHVKRDSDGKFFFFFVLLRFIGSRKCLYA